MVSIFHVMMTIMLLINFEMNCLHMDWRMDCRMVIMDWRPYSMETDEDMLHSTHEWEKRLERQMHPVSTLKSWHNWSSTWSNVLTMKLMLVRLTATLLSPVSDRRPIMLLQQQPLLHVNRKIGAHWVKVIDSNRAMMPHVHALVTHASILLIHLLHCSMLDSSLHSILMPYFHGVCYCIGLVVRCCDLASPLNHHLNCCSNWRHHHCCYHCRYRHRLRWSSPAYAIWLFDFETKPDNGISHLYWVICKYRLSTNTNAHTQSYNYIQKK